MKTFKFTTTLLVIISCLNITAKPATAGETLFSEDFSQGLNKWQPVRDDGQMWRVVDGQAEVYIANRFTVTELALQETHWQNEWRDIEYQLEFTPLEGADKNIAFKFNNLKNWYELHFINETCNLVRLKDGQIPFSHFSWITPLVNGRTYTIKIQTLKERIIVFLDSQVIIDTIDLSYNQNGGRISLKAGTGAAYPTRVKFDNILVKAIDIPTGKQLNVPLHRQIDSAWKNLEYDHATKWSEASTTIGRWGCALASASMILNYHGITKLADGSALNPASLNNWLKSQTDGFIDGVRSGYINWIAITRLTQELHDKYQTTKLETSRQAGPNLLKTVITEIDSYKPSVLEIAGHFLVASGYTTDKSDLYIKDPAYLFDLFSKHQTDLKSVRTFQPSQTDLSYLLLAHDPTLQVELTQLDGTAVDQLQTYTEVIKDPTENSTQTMPAISIHEWAKPSGGQYILKISQANFGPFKLQFFAYDTRAKLTDLSQTGWVGQQPLIFKVNYERETASSLNQQLSLKQWRQQFKYLWEIKQIKKSYAYSAIDRIAKLGETQPSPKQARYVNYLQHQLDQYSRTMTETAKKFLEQQLADIIWE